MNVRWRSEARQGKIFATEAASYQVERSGPPVLAGKPDCLHVSWLASPRERFVSAPPSCCGRPLQCRLVWRVCVRICREKRQKFGFPNNEYFTRDNHEEVFLTGGGLGQILHDVPVALNQLLHLIRLFVTIIFLGFILIVILAVLLVSLPSPVLLLLGSILKTNKRRHKQCSVLFDDSTGYKHTVLQIVWITSPYKTLEGSLPFTPPQLAGSIHSRNSQHRENEMDREWNISLEWMLVEKQVEMWLFRLQCDRRDNKNKTS